MKAYVLFGVDAEKPGCVMKSGHFHFYFYVFVDSRAILEFKCVGDKSAIGLYFECMSGYLASQMSQLGIKKVVFQNGRRIRSPKDGCRVIYIDQFGDEGLIEKFKEFVAGDGIEEVSE